VTRGRLSWLVRGRDRVVRASERLLRLGCRLRSPRIVALAWTLATGPLERHVADGHSPYAPTGTTGRPGPRPVRIVLLPKAGGSEDVRDAAATAPLGQRIEVCGLPRRHVREVFRIIVGRVTVPSLTDTDYRAGDRSGDADKLRYRRFLVRTLRTYTRWNRVAGFVTANVGFRAERELAAACTELGIGFVVLHKESIRTSSQRAYFTRSYRELLGPFGGHSIGVYNDDERDSVVESGMAPPERVHVVGCPRIDRLHHIRERRAGRRPEDDAPVVLFAIDAHGGTWTPYDDSEATGAPTWERLAALTDEAFVVAARSMPERAFVIKTKIGRERQQLDRLPVDRPPNLTVVSQGIGTSLLERAAVVVGFNSTVLLEALAVGAPTLVPRYAEAADAGSEGWRFDLTGAVIELDAPERMPDAIAQALTNGYDATLSDGATAALERYVANADGRASERAWTLLVGSLGPDRRRRPA
jgi:hypothetical protein